MCALLRLCQTWKDEQDGRRTKREKGKEEKKEEKEQKEEEKERKKEEERRLHGGPRESKQTRRFHSPACRTSFSSLRGF